MIRACWRDFDLGAYASLLEDRADAAESRGDAPDAIELLDEAFEVVPRPDIGLRLGSLRLSCGHVAAAESTLRAVLEPLDPEDDIPLDVLVRTAGLWRIACEQLGRHPEPAIEERVAQAIDRDRRQRGLVSAAESRAEKRRRRRKERNASPPS